MTAELFEKKGLDFYWIAKIKGHTYGSGVELEWGKIKSDKDIDDFLAVITEVIRGQLRKILIDRPKWIRNLEKK